MSEQKSRTALPQGVLDLIPQTDVCTKALAIAQDVLPEPIFNHSLRVFLLSKYVAEKENSEWLKEYRLPLLFVAAVCHDLGTSDLYNGKHRFEVEGADAAKAHLLAHGSTECDSHDVWIAIAVHTSPGIAERVSSLSRLVRYGVKSDFSPAYRDGLGLGLGEYAAQIEELLPRLDIEKALGDAVVKQAVKIAGPIDSMTYPDSQKFPRGSWPGILLRAHLENPEWDGVSPAF